jgi:hypothetical protein
VVLGQGVQVDLGVQGDRVVFLVEVHVAVREHVIDEQFIVEEDRVGVFLVAAMGIDSPFYLDGGLRTDFDGEGAFACVGGFLKSFEIGMGLYMSEDGFGGVGHLLSVFFFEVRLEGLYLALDFAFEAFSDFGSG